jgi:hypothetical protein
VRVQRQPIKLRAKSIHRVLLRNRETSGHRFVCRTKPPEPSAPVTVPTSAKVLIATVKLRTPLGLPSGFLHETNHRAVLRYCRRSPKILSVKFRSSPFNSAVSSRS